MPYPRGQKPRAEFPHGKNASAGQPYLPGAWTAAMAKAKYSSIAPRVHREIPGQTEFESMSRGEIRNVPEKKVALDATTKKTLIEQIKSISKTSSPQVLISELKRIGLVRGVSGNFIVPSVELVKIVDARIKFLNKELENRRFIEGSLYDTKVTSSMRAFAASEALAIQDMRSKLTPVTIRGAISLGDLGHFLTALYAPIEPHVPDKTRRETFL